VALLHSGVYFFSLGLGMTTDAPCLFGWFLTLAFAYKAVFQEEISHSWKWAGACAGFAALSKYTAVFIFPSILFTFLVVPSLRPQLYRVRFWQGWGISLMALLPVFVWNFNNGWVNLLHNSNHLIPQQPGQLRAGNILEVLAACVFMTGPILLGVLAHFICTYIRNRETASYHETMAAKVHFFLIPGLGLLGVCLVVALQKRVYPNWIAPVFLYFTIAAAFAWRHTDRRLEHYGTWIKYGLALNCIVLIIGTSGVLGFTWGIPSSRLPVRKLIGWRELGMTVGSLTRNLGTTSVPIVTDSYELASELAFYTPNHPVVYCARVGERRMNQYDIWGGWEKLAGKAVLLVLRTDRVPQTLGEHFQDIRSLSTPFSVIHQHETLRTFYFFIGTDYDGSRPKDGTFF
jgi:4-amino-4-deoxy-L-arabinose transferase-like glycosyltransferase